MPASCTTPRKASSPPQLLPPACRRSYGAVNCTPLVFLALVISFLCRLVKGESVLKDRVLYTGRNPACEAGFPNDNDPVILPSHAAY